MLKFHMLHKFCLAVLGAMLLASCAAPKLLVPEPAKITVAPQYAEAYKEFLDQAELYRFELPNRDLQIVGGNDEPELGQVGMCKRWIGQTATISINDAKWRASSKFRQTISFSHLMGHCLLSKPENAALTADGAPLSLMYPGGLDELQYEANEGPYLGELFGKDYGQPMLINQAITLPQFEPVTLPDGTVIAPSDLEDLINNFIKNPKVFGQ